MSMGPKSGGVIGSSDGALAGSHAVQDGNLTFQVAPATEQQVNTLRLPLVPVACWRVDDIRFAFDSSFITPDVSADLELLGRLREKHKNVGGLYPPLSVFGHADPVGTDDYNKALSGRRADAVYALLISKAQPSVAAGIWQGIAQHEHWEDDQNGVMQASADVPAGTTGTALYQAYMQTLYPSSFMLTPQDFLGRGSDSKRKGDVQGCSEFNPLMIFSQADSERYDQGKQDNDQPTIVERNAANASNRRVHALLFRPGSQVVASKWPCPTTNDGVSGCRARFWSDGDARRSTRLDVARRYEVSGDTFACRFYDRLSAESPCEQYITITEYPFSE
jgi:hypothetical protein